MGKISEGRFKGYQDAELYFQVWKSPAPRGTLVITHGHGEHSDSYRRVVAALENQGWNIYAWDMRGHGRSEGIRGFAESFDHYCEDLKVFLNLMKTQADVKNRPLVYLSHSMGALVMLKTLLSASDLQPDALILSSPLVGLGVHVPAIKKVGAEWLKRLMPTVTLWNEIRSKDLTRDPEIIREFEQDAFRHARISAGAFLGFAESFASVQAGARNILCKTIMLISDKDPIVSTPEAIKFFENLGSQDKQIKIYADAKHELFNDIIREEVFQDLREFLETVNEHRSEPDEN